MRVGDDGELQGAVGQKIEASENLTNGMAIISSQQYLDEDIVAHHMEQMQGQDELVLEVVDSGGTDDDGNDLMVLYDGHHRKAAAENLGIPIRYTEISDRDRNQMFGNLTGEDFLESNYIDSEWRYISSNRLVW